MEDLGVAEEEIGGIGDEMVGVVECAASGRVGSFAEKGTNE
jgi:hypothetical protein